MLDRFAIDHAHPSWPTNIWLGAMIRLYRPEIERLIEQRDQAIADWQASHVGVNVFEDRALEITSSLDINIDEKLAAVQ